MPSTHAVLAHPTVAALRTSLSHDILASLVRQAKEMLNGARTKQEALDLVVDDVVRAAASLTLPSRRLINATGIVIHSGLGTAPLSPMAQARMLEAAGATPTGAEGLGGRTEVAERQLRVLTGAEAACVTVQNAATCTLLGAALAAGREIVCAARDLLEISHGICLGDLIQAGGARVVPVGSANCVHLADYERAINPRTALVLRIWHSNYASTGYTSHVTTQALARLAHTHDVPLAVNLGAGSLVDLRERGLPFSPTIQGVLSEGTDLVLASGDKLIGGPQAGIVVGAADLIQQLVVHPLYRAVRPAKLEIAALEGTLASYLAGRPWEEIPVLRMLAATPMQLEERARAIATAAAAGRFDATAISDTAMCGGAALPGAFLLTWAVRLTSTTEHPDALYRRFQQCHVVGRRTKDAFLLDLRSVCPEDDKTLMGAIGEVAVHNSAVVGPEPTFQRGASELLTE
ncbi:MAG TPA: L-seryl-tRNA(Sec) selenium transferase [Tepidiformaceae bacterium]|nr:L-seryl-tRNA(Sec) selenium transferase [Tepidiformaceae bacterium]